MERTLHSLEELLSLIFDNSPTPIFVCAGEELIIEFANKAALKLWGKDHFIIGHPIPEVVGEVDGQQYHEILQSVFRSGTVYRTEIEPAECTEDDRRNARHFRFTYQPLRNNEGTIWGVLCTADDLTELVGAKKQLEESQENLYKIIAQAPVAVCILSGRSLIVEIANQKMLELWGTTGEILGKPLFEGLPEVKGQGFEELLESVLNTGDRVSASEVPAMLNRDGKLETVYLNFVYEPLKENNGIVTRVLAVAVEVTESVLARKEVEESERQLRQIADSMPQIVWVTAPSGYHEYFNQQWYEFTLSSFDESKGDGWTKYFDTEDLEKAWKVWQRSLNTGETYEVEYRIKNGKTGEYRWFLGRAVPIFDEQGQIKKWFGTCTDIHEQKQLLQKKDDFIGIASHELKTPLTALKALLQLMKRIADPGRDEKLKVLINQGNNSVNKLSFLVEELLNVTKVDQGQLQLNKEAFSLADVVNACCQHVRVEVTHDIILEGDLYLKVYGDMHRIEQVLVNLINNAVKYAPGSKEIHVKIEDEKDFARVSVKDRGRGIAPEKVPHLFDRYYRAEANSGQIPGLGLGLYISHEIVSKHGGTMGVDSTLGKGSTFWFTLPVYKEGMG